MQELVGRLSALDPEASETLKVVTYFDALVGAGASTDALVRAAAALSGTVAGASFRNRVNRRGPDGQRIEDDHGVRFPRRAVPEGEVWLERSEDAHANDHMIVERLALAVAFSIAKHQPESALQIAVDSERTTAERTRALAKLRVNAHQRVRAVALPLADEEPGSAPILAEARIIRVVLDAGTRALPRRGGIGPWMSAHRLPESWEQAATALRLTNEHNPVVDAGELGALLLVARGFDVDAPPEDVIALAALDERQQEILRAIATAESLRAAAAALGLHHSTAQARHEALTRHLGFDPRSAVGRARYVASELLLRLRQEAAARRAKDS